MGRRTLGIAAALLALLAVAVGGVLAIESDDEEPRDMASETGTGTAVETGTAGETSPTGTESETPAEPDRTEETELERAPEPNRAPDPEPAPAPAAEPARYTAYSAGSGDWQTVVPSGGGWQQPVEAGQGSARLRVTVRGPRGAVLLIDHTPNAAARFGSKYRSQRELSQPWFGSMAEYTLAGDAVGYVLNASESGPGFRGFATGADPAVARSVANRLTYVDL